MSVVPRNGISSIIQSARLNADGDSAMSINKLQKDLELITSKINEYRGGGSSHSGSAHAHGHGQQKSAIAVVSSSFVSGIRKATEMGDNERLPILERVLEKLTELDREVLRKTAPTSGEDVGRRSAARADLSVLPTHLHITDRLLDLYAQAQRVTVVRTSTTIVESSNKSPTKKEQATAAVNDQAIAESQRQISRLEAKVASMMKQLSDNEEKALATQMAMKTSKMEIAELTKSLAQLESANEALRHAAAMAATTAASAAVATVTSLPPSPTKNVMDALEERNRQLEMRLEVEVGINQHMIAAIHGAADSFTKDGIIGDVGATALSSEGQKALQYLATATKKVSEQRSVAFASMQREGENAQTKIETLQKELAYLLAAHEEIKTEVSSLRAHDRVRKKEQQEAAKTSADDNSQLVSLQEELQKALNLVADMQKLPGLLEETMMKLSKKEQELDAVKFDIHQLSEELNSYKKLADSLKAKIRDMGGKDASFFDSFEEVMKDEMMAMKWAFEAKLRVAREKADAMSAKHQQEINKLQSQNNISGKLMQHSKSSNLPPGR